MCELAASKMVSLENIGKFMLLCARYIKRTWCNTLTSLLAPSSSCLRECPISHLTLLHLFSLWHFCHIIWHYFCCLPQLQFHLRENIDESHYIFFPRILFYTTIPPSHSRWPTILRFQCHLALYASPLHLTATHQPPYPLAWLNLSLSYQYYLSPSFFFFRYNSLVLREACKVFVAEHGTELRQVSPTHTA